MQIHANYRPDYEKGIAGIGVGLDYLIQNSFFDASDDIFDDFDNLMYRAVMYDPFGDFSCYGGLIGYGYYWMTRIRKETSIADKCLLRILEHIEESIYMMPIKEKVDVYIFLMNLDLVYKSTIVGRILCVLDKMEDVITNVYLYKKFIDKFRYFRIHYTSSLNSVYYPNNKHICTSSEELINTIKEWKLNYCVYAPIIRKVSLTTYWNEKQLIPLGNVWKEGF
ncbi:MAG: hypothetical protein SOR57_04865 [Parabacteroides sp.]|nr:hypothetical protein [Parabacteroides sp.]